MNTKPHPRDGYNEQIEITFLLKEARDKAFHAYMLAQDKYDLSIFMAKQIDGNVNKDCGGENINLKFRK